MTHIGSLAPARGAARAPPIFTKFLLSEFSMPPISVVFRMREPNLGGYCIPPSTLPTQHTNNLVYPSFWATATKTHFLGSTWAPNLTHCLHTKSNQTLWVEEVTLGCYNAKIKWATKFIILEIWPTLVGQF